MVRRIDNSGQIQTVEAITAALLLLSVLTSVVVATSITPLTTSFTNEHIKLELQNMGTDILTSLDETPYAATYTSDPSTPSQLKKSITDWCNWSDGGKKWYAWSNDSTKYISLADPTDPPLGDTPLTSDLTLLLRKYGIAYNVDIRYSDITGQMYDTKVIWNGDPSDNSVTVSRIITLHRGDLISDNPIIPPVSTTSDFYNAVEVRLTLWVM